MIVRIDQTYADMYNGYQAGQILSLPDSQARRLIECGVASSFHANVLEMMDGLNLKGFIVNSDTPAEFAALAKKKGYSVQLARKKG